MGPQTEVIATNTGSRCLYLLIIPAQVEFLAVALRDAQRIIAEQNEELAVCRRQRQQVMLGSGEADLSCLALHHDIDGVMV